MNTAYPNCGFDPIRSKNVAGNCLTEISAVWAYNPLMEPSLNDGEVVVQAGRSAKVVNMIQKFIHKASLRFG